MPAKKPYKVDIDVVPYLSIMAIVLKLICLILIVMVMRIAINPDALKVIRYQQLYQPPEEAAEKVMGQTTQKQINKEPTYLDCQPDRIEIQPSGTILSLMELKERDGEFQSLLHTLDANSKSNFAIIIARPGAESVYRFVRRQIAARKLTVGYDVLESDVIIDWTNAMSRLQIKVKDLEERRKAQLKATGSKVE